jgi:hypothetical protein
MWKWNEKTSIASAAYGQHGVIWSSASRTCYHVDGRKLAGVKRRLEQLGSREPPLSAAAGACARRIERLVEAEGYFRALADGLRT